MPARVLVVDDVEVNVKLLEAKLTNEYFTVLPAYNGAEALRVAEHEPVDIVLLDVMMPQMDGFEVCRRLKANPRTADVPVVMVTALSDVADRVRGLEAGADEFLTKPVNDTALFARLRSLVRLKRMLEEWRLREEICGRLSGQASIVAETQTLSQILLLEEDPFAAARIVEMLAPMTETVVHTASCAEAQERLDGGPELFIASLTVPDGDPLRLVSQCRAQEDLRQLPILLVAEDTDLPRLAKGLDLGANDYLVRPVDRNELLARTTTQIRRKRLHERLRDNYRRSLSLALTDELTGLYNRRFLYAHLDELLERIEQGGVGAAILMFDIDFFKAVNDTYGHLAGDDVLRELAARATRGLRSVDLVARLGGEEFAVVMPETDLESALTVAERLRQEVAQRPFAIRESGKSVPITISVGVTTTAAGGETRSQLLQRADEPLYRAKRSGRNRVVAEGIDLMPMVAAAS